LSRSRADDDRKGREVVCSSPGSEGADHDKDEPIKDSGRCTYQEVNIPGLLPPSEQKNREGVIIRDGGILNVE